jgi:5,10-methylenetetrahydromethanopterin reductase
MQKTWQKTTLLPHRLPPSVSSAPATGVSQADAIPLHHWAPRRDGGSDYDCRVGGGKRPEVFLHAFPLPTESVQIAERAEAEGWDGLLLADSQNLQADVYVELALAARATERLRLGPGVTNPLTRHPAVTASAIATLQVESAGRAVLGISRGDSAVTFVGLPPASVSALEAYVERLQTYLRGDVQDADGFASRIEWLKDYPEPKVPVDVAATGPKTIAAAARWADRVTFSLGADPERIEWAIGVARASSRAAGRDLPSLGAFVIVAPDPDVSRARDVVRGNVAIFANFFRTPQTLNLLSDPDRRTVREVKESYEASQHGLTTAAHTAVVSDDFVDRFAIVGPPDHCVARLRELTDRGLDHLVVLGPSKDVHPGDAARLRRDLAEEVLPALRT